MSNLVSADLWDDLGLWDGSAHRFGHCVLHIGMEKTGTTTLQDMLGANRTALLEAGYFVPNTLAPYAKRANHERLTTFALSDTKLSDDLRRNAKLSNEDDLAHHREAVAQALRDEILALPDTVSNSARTLLLSNEHCQSRLTEPDEVRRLKTFLDEFTESYRIVVYLRPQHDVAVSLYDQALKAGYADIPLLPDYSGRSPLWVHRGFFDYADLLERWGAVFGRDAMDVRLYRRDQLAGGDVVRDFLDRLGLDPDAYAAAPTTNASMSAAMQIALNAINRYLQRSGSKVTPTQRDGLITCLQAQSRGPGRRPARREAAAFYHSFALSNEAVRAQYFPDQDTLFDSGLDRYSETVDEPDEVDCLAEALISINGALSRVLAAATNAQPAPHGQVITTR